MMARLNNLMLNPKTKADLEGFLAKPFHFLLIEGLPGSGKSFIALNILGKALASDAVQSHPYFYKLEVPPGKKDIPIEAVRDLIDKLKLRVPGNSAWQRAVYIESGQYLSEEAQNALLKLLEEPPSDTLIVMSVDATNSILPTIASRGQIIKVGPVSAEAAQRHFNDHHKESEIESAWRLSGGLAGLLTSVLLDEDNQMKQAIADAKQFIRQSAYERLLNTNISRDDLKMKLLGLQRLLAALQPTAKDSQQIKLLKARKLVSQCLEALEANVTAKNVHLKLALNLNL